MEWIDARIAELRKVHDAFMADYTGKRMTDKERGHVSLILMHLDMHIKDLERVREGEVK